jgi:hypothetical protein
MERRYSCPKCRAMLNPEGTIILLGVQGEQRVLVGFHPEPGNYEVHVPPDTKLERGAQWDLLCPVCHENLATDDLENLCELDLWEEGKQLRVFFSRVSGEKVTFVVAGRKVEAKYGEHVTDYTPLLLNREYFL